MCDMDAPSKSQSMFCVSSARTAVLPSKHLMDSTMPCHLEVSIVMGVPHNGWFRMENPTKMDDLGDTPISGNHHFNAQSDGWFGRLWTGIVWNFSA